MFASGMVGVGVQLLARRQGDLEVGGQAVRREVVASRAMRDKVGVWGAVVLSGHGLADGWVLRHVPPTRIFAMQTSTRLMPLPSFRSWQVQYECC